MLYYLPFLAPGGGSYMKDNPSFAFSSPSRALKTASNNRQLLHTVHKNKSVAPNL